MTGLHSTLAAALLCAVHPPAAAPETAEQTLSRMDQNAANFKSLSAKIRQLEHYKVINEENVSEGTIHLKRSKHDVRVLVHLTSPDEKSVALSGTKVEMYLPKLKTVQEYNFGSSTVEKFLALGFGASGNDLKQDYTIRFMDEGAVNGEKTARLELIPKDKQVLKQFPKIELDIPLNKGYPVQEKLYQTGGDYMVITYSDVAINPPLPDSAFKLQLPKGVKREFPQK
jgi:outer membrane lipoprotein-sorting protein